MWILQLVQPNYNHNNRFHNSNFVHHLCLTLMGHLQHGILNQALTEQAEAGRLWTR